MFGFNITWILASAISIILIFVCRNVSKIYDYWLIRGVPYAKPVWGFGNLSFIMRKSAWEFFDDLRRKHPLDYVGIYLGWQPALVVQSPELARRILVKDFKNFQDRYLYSNSSDPLGSLNLFTVKNPIWSEMRHHVAPSFTTAKLRTITELMNLNATELVQKIQRDYIDKKQPVNLKELFTMYTSDTVGYTVFGLRVSVLSGSDSPLWVITSHIVRWTFWRGLEFTMIFFMPVIAKIFKFKFFSGPATEYVKQLFWNVVKERENSKTTEHKDLVQLLLKMKETMKLPAEAGSQLADDLMLAQAAVFILGSVETSSGTLSSCLHELAHHPEEQEKLYKEVSDALTRSGKEVLEYDDLMELEYLSACLYETMRKHPAVPYLDRICAKAYDLEGVRIEEGVPVLVNVVALHHDPRYHPNPELWDPSRPTAASENDNLGYTFLPFGEGPRFCIGKRYGMMQMRAALAQLIHKYRVEPGPVPYIVQPDPYSVLLAPKNGGCVKFVRRHKAN
ncbi:cytochrome P450 6k1-like [Pectinophora gossypiella]|uniref:unspecific monooxygenase n=2 Tax=Pectinophora gossypiella TaxID=13191 RepID=A0A1E1WI40_PECGO|nr:cytochrome P450 6k1-like [Pectinophora gossypiella]DAB41792.1 TPA_inf: cytochrome P450 CYP332A34 [Pectinophora gossypiella]